MAAAVAELPGAVAVVAVAAAVVAVAEGADEKSAAKYPSRNR